VYVLNADILELGKMSSLDSFFKNEERKKSLDKKYRTKM